MSLTLLDGAILGIPIGISLAVLAFGLIVRPPHCEICHDGVVAYPAGLLPSDPLVADVMTSAMRPCAKTRQLQRLAGAGAPRGGAR